MNKPTIWIDFTNVPHINFLFPFYKKLNENYDFLFTLRDFAETKNLYYKTFDKEVTIVGKHKGQNKIAKVLGVFERIRKLNKAVGPFDIKVSVGGDASSVVAKLRGKKSITFDDNEKAPNWRYSRFSDFAFWPKAISEQVLFRQGFKKHKLYQYDGFKEDIYIADYVPDPEFPSLLPFKDYLVVRPENIQANYVEGNDSIVPELLQKLESKGFNILFLPRYEHDREYARGIKNIFMPEAPMNGLDLCYYSSGVLTGAGTLAREAACLGVPSVSFYAGKELLTVDQEMIKKEWMFFSRNTDEIVDYISASKKRKADLARSKQVKEEVINKLTEVLSKFES
jgi:predicted glycosyltransferase